MFGAVDYQINQAVKNLKPPDIPLCADVQTMMKIAYIYESTGTFNEALVKNHDIVGIFVEKNTLSILKEDLFKLFHQYEKPIALVGGELDNPQIIKDMIRYGADILFSDRPDVLRQTLDSVAQEKK
ncbi:unnamed protein product [Didymodactylos carnosus]|nr:unnamed protein product [Didymodactylos carnosus]CAF3754989.1 unnamed protein product [Didymodactylos carnosus]